MFLLSLDSLEWKPWPKDPSFQYVDLYDDQVRISKNLTSGYYSVRLEFYWEVFVRTRPIMHGLTAEDVELLLAHLQNNRWLEETRTVTTEIPAWLLNQ